VKECEGNPKGHCFTNEERNLLKKTKGDPNMLEEYDFKGGIRGEEKQIGSVFALRRPF
jgi:hypothetical protein